ncbi:MAG: hypothetical protein LUC31_00300 [Coprobacillus sp.]|nr:hypothetical protein [Coprobacillus sp.]
MPDNKKTQSSGLSSVGMMIIATVLLFVAALMMFFPNLKTLTGDKIFSANEYFFASGIGTEKSVWPVFVGYMLITLSAFGTLVMALPFVKYSYKTEKIVFISLMVAEIIGFALVALTCVFYSGINDNFKKLNMLSANAGIYICCILTGASAIINYFILRADKI